MRGNAIDMAVGFVIGVAFTTLINSIVNGLLLPLISVPGKVVYSSWSFALGGGVFMPGEVLTALITFLVVAAVIFFVVIRPIAMLEHRRKAREAKPPVTTKECPECASTIPLKAHKCMYCTSPVG